ncbi:19790_t:CDS:2 [Gigaspora margarita]|uniref:19790_t:CDS:1 n=1 Tax=Gigaspora margarita TaxID=4874 RepID=A0ABN7VEC8_GIGMA|nr:19790_t:CDS:2 [Gigaspora margarita]
MNTKSTKKGYIAALNLALQQRYIRFSDINPKIEATIQNINPKLELELEELIKTSIEFIKEVVSSNYQNLDIDNLLSIIFDQYQEFYPNIIKLLEIIYSIPFSSVECERGFSKQNLIKTSHRNRINNDTLHLFLSISLVDKNINEFDFEKALNIWSTMVQTSRRIQK